ncbi:MAG: tetratricopeptide repeat protein [Polyangiaceae bacterium]
MLGTKELKRLGRSLTESGRYQQAVVVYRDALRLDPSDARSCDGLSYALYMSCKFAEAIEWSRRALELDPVDSFAEKNIALCLAQLGDRETAVKHLERSIELNCEYFDSHHDLAIVLMDLERWQEARERIEIARALLPERGAILDELAAFVDKHLAKP